MWSDNYVTGDNVYLRELQSFFFDTLGMMSITHYGCIGDGRKDNYGCLQAAIDDANRRGLPYLYVPYGKFIFTGELINLVDPDTGKQRITFVGNPNAKLVNIRTGEEIEILQFGADVVEMLENYYTKTQTDELLGEHYTKAEDDELLAEKQDNLIAGDNIEIVNDVISSLTSQHCITAKGGSDYSPTSTDVSNPDTIPLTTSVVTGGFQLSNNGVVIGPDSNSVLVSARIAYTAVAGNARIFALKKNTTAVFQVTIDNDGADAVEKEVVIPPMLINVEEDDVITLQTVAVSTTGDTIHGGYNAPYLTVQQAGNAGSDAGTLFITSRIPTNFPHTANAKTLTQTNAYGEWTVSTNTRPETDTGGNQYLENVFDNDLESGWKFYVRKEPTELNPAGEFEIDLPSGVTIKPYRIYICASNGMSKGPIIYGYDPVGETWDTLATITSSFSSSAPKEIDMNPNKYYSKFKLANIKGPYTLGSATLYELSIPIGRIKVES